MLLGIDSMDVYEFFSKLQHTGRLTEKRTFTSSPTPSEAAAASGGGGDGVGKQQRQAVTTAEGEDSGRG